MKFLDFFKNIKLPSVKNTSKIKSDNSYCYSNIIWNTPTNLIILISFTEDYFSQIIEIQDSINTVVPIDSKFVYSSYEEETDRKDDDGNPIIIIHKKYYMLIGGEPDAFNVIYHNIHDLGNTVLGNITNEIINNCDYKWFKGLIDDGILNGFNNEPVYDAYKQIDGVLYDDPEIILKRLPNGFTGRDMLKFIHFTYSNGYNDFTNLYTLLGAEIVEMNNEQFKSSGYYTLYATLFKNPTVDKLKLVLEPLYKQPDDDSIPGDISDESLDIIFRENYERFSAVNDDNIIYEDIDEILDDAEESENMREEGRGEW